MPVIQPKLSVRIYYRANSLVWTLTIGYELDGDVGEVRWRNTALYSEIRYPGTRRLPRVSAYVLSPERALDMDLRAGREWATYASMPSRPERVANIRRTFAAYMADWWQTKVVFPA